MIRPSEYRLNQMRRDLDVPLGRWISAESKRECMEAYLDELLKWIAADPEAGRTSDSSAGSTAPRQTQGQGAADVSHPDDDYTGPFFVNGDLFTDANGFVHRVASSDEWEVTWEPVGPAPVGPETTESNSILRRKAAQRGEPDPFAPDEGMTESISHEPVVPDVGVAGEVNPHEHHNPSPSQVVAAWCNGTAVDPGCHQLVPLYQYKSGEYLEAYLVDGRGLPSTPSAGCEAILSSDRLARIRRDLASDREKWAVPIGRMKTTRNQSKLDALEIYCEELLTAIEEHDKGPVAVSQGVAE